MNKSQAEAISALMHQDALLPKEIHAENLNPAPESIQTILLIGATGVVGSYLLDALRQKTAAKIYCLVHERHADNAENYIITQLKNNALNSNIDVTIITGNIAKPFLGLDEKTWDMLGKTVDLIFHNAAWTNHIRPYSWKHEAHKADIRETNTLSLRESLRLASSKKLKYLHFTSTLGSINRVNLYHQLPEELPSLNNTGDGLNAGYIQSKFVAEQLIEQAIARGIPCQVFRLGQVTGNSNTGMQHADKDHMMLELKSCVQLGIAPDWSVSRSFVPVDIAANIMATIALDLNEKNKVYNVNNPSLVSWTDIIKALNKHNHAIRILPEQEWIDGIANIDESNALYPLRSAYQKPHQLADYMPSLQYMFNGEIVMGNLLTMLQKNSIHFPDSHDLLEKYINYFDQSGFFK